MRVEFREVVTLTMAATLLAIFADVAEDAHPSWHRRSSLKNHIFMG